MVKISFIGQVIVLTMHPLIGRCCGTDDDSSEGYGEDCVGRMFLAPSYGGFMEIYDDKKSKEVFKWQGLPQSLKDALNKYSLIYGGVGRLSVGVQGEWFVQFRDGFHL